MFLKPVHEAAEACVAARDDDVLEEVSSYVDVSLANRVDHHVLDAREAQNLVARCEHLLHKTNPFAAERTRLAVWKLDYLRSDALSSSQALQRFFGRVQELFFDVPDDLRLTVLKEARVAVFNFKRRRRELLNTLHV